MATTQSLPSDFEHRAKQATANTPFAGTDEYLDTRLGEHATSVDAQNSTYIGLNWSDSKDRKQFLRQVPDERVNYYAKLELYNRGTHILKWTTDESAKRDNDDFLFCGALTNQMGLPKWMRKAVWRLFKPMDMREYARFDTPKGEPEYKQYLVAFCIAAVLYNHYLPERSEKWRYYPTTESYPCKSKRYRCPHARLRAQEKGDDGDGHRVIERVADRMGFTEEDLVSCYQMVLSRIGKYLGDDNTED